MSSFAGAASPWDNGARSRPDHLDHLVRPWGWEHQRGDRRKPDRHREGKQDHRAASHRVALGRVPIMSRYQRPIFVRIVGHDCSPQLDGMAAASMPFVCDLALSPKLRAFLRRHTNG